ENPALRDCCAQAREGGRLHLIGLVSAGGVHSSLGHLHACIQLATRERVPEIVLHAFTAGGPGARIGTVMGRYWGMDRDGRWDRTRRAYDAIVHGRGARAVSAREAV